MFSLDAATMLAKAIDGVEMLRIDHGFFRGISRSTFGPHGPQLVHRRVLE